MILYVKNFVYFILSYILLSILLVKIIRQKNPKYLDHTILFVLHYFYNYFYFSKFYCFIV